MGLDSDPVTWTRPVRLPALSTGDGHVKATCPGVARARASANSSHYSRGREAGTLEWPYRARQVPNWAKPSGQGVVVAGMEPGEGGISWVLAGVQAAYGPPFKIPGKLIARQPARARTTPVEPNGSRATRGGAQGYQDQVEIGAPIPRVHPRQEARHRHERRPMGRRRAGGLGQVSEFGRAPPKESSVPSTSESQDVPRQVECPNR